MIAVISCVTLALFVWLLAWCLDDLPRVPLIACRCGLHQAHRPVIFDEVDRERIAATLTELCPICRSQARAGVTSSPPYQGGGGGVSDPSPPTKGESRGVSASPPVSGGSP